MRTVRWSWPIFQTIWLPEPIPERRYTRVHLLGLTSHSQTGDIYSENQLGMPKLPASFVKSFLEEANNLHHGIIFRTWPYASDSWYLFCFSSDNFSVLFLAQFLLILCGTLPTIYKHRQINERLRRRILYSQHK